MDGSTRTDDTVEREQDSMTTSGELRLLEAMLFAAREPVTEDWLVEHLPDDVDIEALLRDLVERYRQSGVNLVKVGGRWTFRTAPDLADALEVEVKVRRKLSRAAVETLAVIAYHQPVTRGEIEEIRGVALSRGTLDMLLEIGWIRPVGRRRTPGRPVTWGTSQDFLDHFNLADLGDLPGLDELKAAGLLDTRPVRTIFGEIAAMGEAAAESDGEADATSEEDMPESAEPLPEEDEAASHG